MSHLNFDIPEGFLNFLVHQGRNGVEFFFLISGFLITYLLLTEKLYKRTLSLSKFYIRRILRIWPLYFLVIGLIIIFSFSFEFLDVLPGNTWLYAIFLGNFDRILNNYDTVNQLPGFGVLWSISVEEQFYLFIPILIFLVKDSKKLITLFVIIHIFIILYKIYIIKFIDDDALAFRNLHFHPLASFDLITFGCILAWTAKKFPIFVEKIANSINIKNILVSFLAVLLIYSFIYRLDNVYLEHVVLPEILGLFFSQLVLFICFNISGRSMNNSILTLLNRGGKISYGLYMYHVPILYIFNIIVGTSMLSQFTSLFTTIIIAGISYKWFEMPFLKIKKRFELVKTQA